MSGRVHDSDYLRRLEGHLIRRAAAADDEPALPVMTCLASHLSALIVFSSTLLVLAPELSVGRLLVLVLWVITSAGAVLRLASVRILEADGARLVFRARWTSAIWASVTGYVITAFVGTDLLVPLVVLVGVISGTRLAAGEADRGVSRAAGFYLRRGFSSAGFATMLLVLVLVIGNGLIWSIVLEPLFVDSPSGLRWPELASLLQVGLAVVVLMPAVLVVCELIASVARGEQRIYRELTRHVKERERQRVSQDLHDRALSLLTAARMYPPDHPGHDRALDQLEMNLRSLQFENELVGRQLCLDRCLRRSRALADIASVDLRLDTDVALLTVPVSQSVALLVDQMFHNLVSNSVAASAGRITADLRIESGSPDLLVGSVRDDAGGFEPRQALERGGGLAQLDRSLQSVGGALHIEPDGAVVRFRLPLTSDNQ